MSRSMTPQVCLYQDFVVQIDQVATKMYFIQQGIVQILASDNKTVIAFQSQGCYFGEIGVLLTQKRSCSVKAVTMCMFMTVSKEDLQKILQNYHSEAKFLRAIGRQRLLTTNPEDLEDLEQDVFEIGDGENVKMKKINDANGAKMSSQTINYLAKQARPDERKKTLLKSDLTPVEEFEEYDDSNASPEVVVERPLQGKDQKLNQIRHTTSMSESSKVKLRKSIPVPINLTEEYLQVTQKVILPFSRLFNIWTAVLFLAFAYFLFMVPFQIALEYDIIEDGGTPHLVIDIIFDAVFLIDIFLRSRLAFVMNQNGEAEIQLNTDQIQSYYVNNLMIYDILATIPFDYVLQPFESYGLSKDLQRLVKLLKFLKIMRVVETITIVKKHSNYSSALIQFALLFAIYQVLAHFMATSYIFIGRREAPYTNRFDGQTMFGDVTGRVFITPVEEHPDRDFEFLKPATEMSKFELYIQFIYLSSCTMGAVMYGDIIPYAMSEQLFDFIAMFTCRIFLAFLFAEAAGYLSSIHKSAAENTKKINKIIAYSDLNHIPLNLKNRVINFYNVLWDNFRGVRQQTILRDLPESLRQDVRQVIFKNVISNWDVINNNKEHGVVTTIIEKLVLRIIPQNEFIIRYGETAQNMYFIIKGQVNIISADGIHLAQLGVGKNFGEMALLLKGNVRNATALAATDVSIAIMSTSDFDTICDLYPSFKIKINEMAQSRVEQNKQTIQRVVRESDRIQRSKTLMKSQTLKKSMNKQEDSKLKSQKSSENSPSKVGDDSFDNQECDLDAWDINDSKAEEMKVPKLKPPINTDVLQTGEASSRSILDNTSKSFLSQPEESKTQRNLLSQRDEHITMDEVKYKKKSDISQKASSKVQPLGQKFTKVSLRASGIREHFENDNQEGESPLKSLYEQYGSPRFLMKVAILLIVIYNIIFIPLQFAYRIEFKGVFMLMEVLTMVLYSLDIFFRINNLKLLLKAGGNLLQSENQIEQTLMDDKDQFNARIMHIKTEIFCTLIAIIPFSLIFQSVQKHEPLLLVNTLCLLRLIKFLPLHRFFEYLKSRNLHKYRVIEAVVTYYLISHGITGCWISMGQFVPDIRETWIRRIPVPRELGMRVDPTLNGISPSCLYIHALYFVVNTISHVAIGDITAVTSEERVFVAIFILFGTFIYVFLYGNMVSIVSDFAPSQQITHFEKYQYVMQRLGPMKQNQRILVQLEEYFEYMWSNDQSQVEDSLLSDLPQGLRSGILLCKFREAIESSLIFKDNTGAIDISLANSINKLIEVKIYMPNEFIHKVGSFCPDTVIILEGQAVLVGICPYQRLGSLATTVQKIKNVVRPMTEDEIIGVLKVGSHFSLDLSYGKNNYQKKTSCHIITTQPTVVGVISKEGLDLLYNSFPDWKKKMETLNDFTFEKCLNNLEAQQSFIDEKMSSETCPQLNEDSTAEEVRLRYLENDFTFCTSDKYRQIISRMHMHLKQLHEDELQLKNILIEQKMFFYGQEGQVFPIFDTQYQEALKKQSYENLMTQQVINVLWNQKDQSIRKRKEAEQSFVKRKFLKCWKRSYLKVNSKSRKSLELIHTINLFYIAIFTPLMIGFSLEMTKFLNFVESLSLVVSLAWIVFNFRTQLVIKGQATLDFQVLLANYKRNGLYHDICGIIPLNIVLGQNVTSSKLIVLKSVPRIVRVFSSWRALELFGRAEQSFKNDQFNIIMQILKALFYIYFLGHFLACMWFFFVNRIQSGEEPTWIDYNELHDKSIGVRYLRCFYTVFNVVCSVGYGDMFPMTDPERVVFTMMITTGDCLFALAYGLITRIAFQTSLADQTKLFKIKMSQIQEFMKDFKLDEAQKQRVDKYFAYEYKQKYSHSLLSYSSLEKYLPTELRAELMYESTKSILEKMFNQFNSENLIRKLAMVVESVIYLPGDYITYKGDVGEEMYFIQEGSVVELADDKQTVLQNLKTGTYFGDRALFNKIKRQKYRQAQTFCIVSILKRKDFEEIIKHFPQILMKLKQIMVTSGDKDAEQDNLVNSPEYSETPHGIDARNILTDVEFKQFYEYQSNKQDERAKDSKSQNQSVNYDSKRHVKAQAVSYVDDLHLKIQSTLQAENGKADSGKAQAESVENIQEMTLDQISEKMRREKKKYQRATKDPEESKGSLKEFFSSSESDCGSSIESQSDSKPSLQKSNKGSRNTGSKQIQRMRSSSVLLDGFFDNSKQLSTIKQVMSNNKTSTERRKSQLEKLSGNQVSNNVMKPALSLRKLASEPVDKRESLRTIFTKRGQSNFTLRRQANNEGLNGKNQRAAAVKPVRRLSRIELGRNLTISQAAGLKLQWTVVNQ